MTDDPGRGQCQKCRSDIHPNAERCPQCGYETSVGWGLRIGALVAGVFVLLFAPNVLAPLFLPFLPGTSLVGAFLWAGFSLLVTLASGWVLRRWWDARNQTVARPHDPDSDTGD